MIILNKKAFSLIEYGVLLAIIIGAFLVMRNNIQRGLFGTWEKSGQSYGYGRQYDSQKSIDCAFDQQSNLWYDRNCYETMINEDCSLGDLVCYESIKSGACATAICNQGSS